MGMRETVRASFLRVAARGCGRGRVLAAYSGGPDSTVLLDLCLGWRDRGGPEVVAAHLHHGLRPEADAEVEHCRSWCASRGVRLLTGRADALARAQQEGESVEEASRALRLSFLLRCARQEGCGAVLTGHTSDDQAETVLMRLLRGTGLRGLGGMEEVRPFPLAGGDDVLLVRPLLRVDRGQVEAYLDGAGLRAVRDASNRDERFLRNRIRGALLPHLEEGYNPRIREALVRMAGQARRWYEALAFEKQRRARELVREEGGAVRVPGGPELARDPVLLHFALCEAFDRAGLSGRRVKAVHFEAVEAAWQEGGRPAVQLPGGWRVRPEGGGVVLERESEEGAEETRPRLTLSGPGSSVELPCGGRVRVGEAEALPAGGLAAQDPWTETADSRSLRFPLCVRSIRPGDRFRPLGAPGRMKLVKFLRLEGLRGRDKRRVWVLEDRAGSIVWVPGFRLSHILRVRASTQSVTRLWCDNYML